MGVYLYFISENKNKTGCEDSISLVAAAILRDWGPGEEEDWSVQTALLELHHRALAVEAVIPVRPQSPGLGVEGAVELLRPTEAPGLSRLQLGPRGARQGRRLGGRGEEG